MDKAEVGEYVRIKQGYVGRVENINDFRPPESEIALDIGKEDLVFVSRENIIKHSKDIIDIIEEGDYVNGRKVHNIGYNNWDDYVLKMSESNYEDFIGFYEIETIVTHEQMEGMEYKIC